MAARREIEFTLEEALEAIARKLGQIQQSLDRIHRELEMLHATLGTDA